MPHSILRNDVAGRDVTRYLKLLLRKEVIIKTTAEFEIVKSIKERVCFLSPTAQKDEAGKVINHILLYLMEHQLKLVQVVIELPKSFLSGINWRECGWYS
jgi:hypothetical protein